MPEHTRRTTIDVPWVTLFKLIAVLALVWLWLQLYPILLVVLVATLIAVTLAPIVSWLERRGLPRWSGASLVSVVLLALIGGFLWLTWSSLNDQAQFVTQRMSEIEKQLTSTMPPWAREIVNNSGNDVSSYVGPYALRFARSAVAALVVSVLGFILTIYLLIEGRRTHDWLIAFVPARHRARTEKTLEECERVVFAYVAGNVATSIFAAVFVLVSLWILEVPAALLLALMAGVFDFIPVLGFVLAAVPALALAATVSNNTMLIVALLYLGYHLVENYLIAPRVYGDRLKLSNVAVILAFAVGAELAGVIGALIALPLAAVYPAVERLWLRDALSDDTVSEHTAIEHRKAG